MKFCKLKIKNFMSFKSCKIDLKKKGIYLIDGLNGAGKSNFLCESLSWCLFGKTIKKVDKDEVVNSKLKKDCFVSIVFELSGKMYRIKRYRKHKKFGNSLLLQSRKGKGNWFDLPGNSSIASTQQSINSLLGLDYFGFTNSVIFGQGNIVRYSNCRDSERKQILEDIMQLLWINDSQKNVKEEIYEQEKLMLSLTNDIDKLNDSIHDLKIRIKENKNIYYLWKQSKCKSLKNVIDNMNDIDEEIDLINYELSDTSGHLQIKKLNKLIMKNYNEIKKLQRAAERYARKNLTGLQSKDWLISQNILLKDKLKHLSFEHENKIYKIRCDKCKQLLKGKALKQYNDSVNKKLKFYKNELFNNEKYIKLHQHYENEFYLKIKVKKCIMADDENKLHHLEKNLLRSENSIEQLHLLMKRHSKSIEIFLEIKNMKTEMGSTVLRDRKLLKAKKKLRKSYADQLDDLEDDMKYLKFWKIGFSNRGIKSLVLSSVMPYLNERANIYSKALTDGNITIKFMNKIKLKSGEVRDKFDIKIKKSLGAKSYRGISGGEKKRADLCIALALRDLIVSRGAKSFNILVLDEIFDELDEIGIEKVLDLLLNLDNQGSSVYVITHNKNLSDEFDKRLTIRNRNGFSEVVK